MIVGILNVLKTHQYYGAGKCTEIAKGKYEYTTTWKGFVRKLKRVLKAKR